MRLGAAPKMAVRRSNFKRARIPSGKRGFYQAGTAEIGEGFGMKTDREIVKDLLPIFEAFAAGRKIQGRYIKADTWCDVEISSHFPLWEELRIKPEPKLCYVIFYSLRGKRAWGTYASRHEAENVIADCRKDDNPRIVEVRDE